MEADLDNPKSAFILNYQRTERAIVNNEKDLKQFIDEKFSNIHNSIAIFTKNSDGKTLYHQLKNSFGELELLLNRVADEINSLK